MDVATTSSVQLSSLLKPILIGGLIAGTFDLTSAFIVYGWGIPRVIAAGLLGRQVIQGGTAPWVFGVFLHYFIAFSAAAIYCFASTRLDFLKPHYVVCGLFYGIAIYLVMTFVVLPLSALHSAGPYKLHGIIQGILIHMCLIGLPIAFCLRRMGN